MSTDQPSSDPTRPVDEYSTTSSPAESAAVDLTKAIPTSGETQPVPEWPAPTATEQPAPPQPTYGTVDSYGQPPAYGQATQPPYGQQPTYGQQAPGYGQSAHGQPTYGQAMAPAPGPYPYAAAAQASGTNTSAMILTIVSAISVLFCGGLLVIPAMVMGIVGLTKQSTDPEGASRMARNGWIAYAVGVVATIIVVIAFFGFFAALMSSIASSTPSTSY